MIYSVNLSRDAKMIKQPSAYEDEHKSVNLEVDDVPVDEVKGTNSQSLKIKVALSDDKVVESEKVIVQEHTIFVDGTRLSERKEIENVQDGKSTFRHTRKIDDRQYTVVAKKEKDQVTSTNFDTLMTPEEFSAFQAKWRIMWHPEMSEDQNLDLAHEEGLTTESETTTAVENAPRAAQSTHEKSRMQHEKKKKRFWWGCC